MTRILPTLILLAASVVAHADTRRFHGYAYDLETERYLYTEVHEQVWEDGRWVRGRIRYHAPDGTLRGEKVLDFSADPYVPLYAYALPGERYAEGITAIDHKTLGLTKTRDGKTQVRDIERRDPLAGDAGFHNFLLARFDELMANRTLAFIFVAAGNLDSYRFRARRIEDTTFEGRAAVRFRVEADSLLRLVAPDLTVTYDPQTRRLLEYRGPSNVIDPDTGKVYRARIAYYGAPPANGPTVLPPLEQGPRRSQNPFPGQGGVDEGKLNH